MIEIDLNDDFQVHSRKRGVIVCLGAFVAAYAALGLLGFASGFLPADIGWVWLNALIYAVLLVIAVLFALLLRQPLREAFPIRKFEKPMFFGSLFTFLGVWFFSTTVNAVQTMIFPWMAEELSDRIILLAEETPFVVALLSIAVLPGIFEELLCRGTMLYALRPFKREWVRILAVGIMFGLLHGLSAQIAYSILLGAGFAYIVIKTGNLLYPMLWHFIINSFSVTMFFLLSRLEGALEGFVDQIPEVPDLAGTAPSAVASANSLATTGMQLGIAFAFAGGGVLFLYGGIRRLNRIALWDVDRKRRRRAQITGIVLLVVGLVFLLGSCTVMIVQELEMSSLTIMKT